LFNIHRTTGINYFKSEVLLTDIAAKRVPVFGGGRRADGKELRAEG